MRSFMFRSHPNRARNLSRQTRACEPTRSGVVGAYA